MLDATIVINAVSANERAVTIEELALVDAAVLLVFRSPVPFHGKVMDCAPEHRR